MITILTFANKNTAGLINFKNSFAKFPDWNLHIIGMGQEWKGWITRMSAYRDFAQQCDPETLLVCLDGYDVLCLRNSDQFYENFKIQNFNAGDETKMLTSVSADLIDKLEKKHRRQCFDC